MAYDSISDDIIEIIEVDEDLAYLDIVDDGPSLRELRDRGEWYAAGWRDGVFAGVCWTLLAIVAVGGLVVICL